MSNIVLTDAEAAALSDLDEALMFAMVEIAQAGHGHAVLVEGTNVALAVDTLNEKLGRTEFVLGGVTIRE